MLDRGARGQGRKVEAHESGPVVASGVANEYALLGAQGLMGPLSAGEGVVSDIESEREGGTRQAPMNAALSPRDRTLLRNASLARIESPLFR